MKKVRITLLLAVITVGTVMFVPLQSVVKSECRTQNCPFPTCEDCVQVCTIERCGLIADPLDPGCPGRAVQECPLMECDDCCPP